MGGGGKVCLQIRAIRYRTLSPIVYINFAALETFIFIIQREFAKAKFLRLHIYFIRYVPIFPNDEEVEIN